MNTQNCLIQPWYFNFGMYRDSNYNYKTITTDHITYIPPNINYERIDKDEYERNLKLRQESHLENVRRYMDDQWRPCLHDQCPSCHGTGIKVNETACTHYISCPCPKCTPTY